MARQSRCGYLILDRKGEYIKDTTDQHGHRVVGLQHHPNARDRMVVVSMRQEFAADKDSGLIHDYFRPNFSIKDIEPVDLADFLPGLTDVQADLIRDYAHVKNFYDKLLAETQFGAVNNRNWYENFPGLFEIKDKGKELLKGFEKQALAEGREELEDAEREELQKHLGGTKSGALERAAGRIKRFCQNPFFGGEVTGRRILTAQSCAPQILDHLARGNFVFIDMRGQPDDDYTMVAALLARLLLNINKSRDDDEQIRASIVMEEAHNILSEDQVYKGQGKGSVFIELAREGRSFKLGFVLVTQQPDAQSIALQIRKTIDTVVAFNMPPDDAKHMQRLKSEFAGLELEISNAPEFHGVAISSGGPLRFKSSPVNINTMKACADGSLALRMIDRAERQGIVQQAPDPEPTSEATSIEDRLASLSRQRRESIQPVALETMKVWQGRHDTETAQSQAAGD
jgi:hypothetical protein